LPVKVNAQAAREPLAQECVAAYLGTLQRDNSGGRAMLALVVTHGVDLPWLQAYFLAAAFFLCLAGSFGRDLPKDPR
jgi:hypothetical protein